MHPAECTLAVELFLEVAGFIGKSRCTAASRQFSAEFEGNAAALCGLDATQPYRDDFLCSKGLNKGRKILIIGPEFSRSITPYVNREIQP